MRSLVTGSSGLLGRCLVERLLERGDELRLIDLEAPDEAFGRTLERHRFVQADVSTGDGLGELASGVDVIYHLAAAQRMKPQFSSWDEQTIFDRNLNGVRQVLRAAERCRVRRVVFVSSTGVYGVPQTERVAEDHPTVPLGAYGESKLQAEALCRAAGKRGVEVVMLRPMSLFGPYMSGVFVILYEWVRTGKPVYLLGRGDNRVQFASARDVADACIRAGDAPGVAGRAFNLGADPDTVPTVLETVRGLIAHAGTGSPVIRIPVVLLRTAARALHAIGQSPIVPEHYILADRDFVLDISAARRDLGWSPRYDNVGMLIDAYEWYVNAGESYWPRMHPLVRLLNRLAPVGRSSA
jgi:nucleoside-diphosphate-sugar epimerase